MFAKRQKVDEMETCKDEVLFNSDALTKIISYLSSVDVLNLAVTCKRFGISNNDDDSIIKESARLLVKDIATEEQLAALPHYNGESSLADYHYLQLLRAPLAFDQIVGKAEYVNNDKSCIRHSVTGSSWETAISNNILRAGKHYVSFTPLADSKSLMMGVMRPGQANESARGPPLRKRFFQNFTRRVGQGIVHCCFYDSYDGTCYYSDWGGGNCYTSVLDGSNELEADPHWGEGLKSMSSDDVMGMLLDLDEGTLSVYKNGRKLGVMKRGLAGQYCWAVSILRGTGVSIKRGTIPLPP